MARKRMLAVMAVLGLMAVAIGCGGGSNSTNSPRLASQQVLITVGDDPASRIASFSVTIESIKLIPASGDPVTVLSTPTTVELTQLAGTAFPLGMATIPQGSYKGAQITVSHPSMTMIDPATGNPVPKPMPAGPFTVNVVFDPAITVGTAPATIHFDINLLGSITIDASGNATFTPKVLGSVPAPLPPGAIISPIPHVMGTVSGVSGTTFTLTTLMGQKSITFQTDASTVFFGISGLSQMQTGMLAVVDAKLQADGSFLAIRVAAKMMPGTGGFTMGLQGLVFSVKDDGTGFQMIMQGGVGPALAATSVGMLVNVTVTSGTVFRVDSDEVDLTGLVPKFDMTTMKPGQRVEVASTSSFMMGSPMMGMPSASIAANQVELEQQALHGAISDYNDSNTFTLTVPADSVFATLTKTTTVTVYKQPGTIVKGTLANGATVLVRGLLLYDGSYKLVASGIMVEPTTL